MLALDSEKKILEKNGEVRSYFAPHEDCVMFDTAGRSNRLVSMAADLLDDDVSIHQSKINSKAALSGDWWECHQDFPFLASRRRHATT